jgi:hypothetical protein
MCLTLEELKELPEPLKRGSFLARGAPPYRVVHPDVLTSYLDGNLVLEIKKAVENQLRDELPGLQPEEAAVLFSYVARTPRQRSRRARRGGASRLRRPGWSRDGLDFPRWWAVAICEISRDVLQTQAVQNTVLWNAAFSGHLHAPVGQVYFRR